jgi:RimJ/RimL family protein N-acetyltransferase
VDDLAHKPTLTGSLVTLRPVTADDAESFGRILADPDVTRLTGSANDSDAAVELPLDSLLEWYGTRGDQDDRLDLAIVDNATGRVVGEVVLKDWDADNRSMGFRTLIGPQGRDRGLGTEATRLIVGYAFEEVGLHRVELEVFSFNGRARHVYERVGFVLEGTRRDALRFDGQWVDSHVMAILEHEWADHRGTPEPPGAGRTST